MQGVIEKKEAKLRHSQQLALAALLNISESEKNALMRDFVSNIRATPELSLMFDSIQRDAKDALTGVSSSEILSMDTNWTRFYSALLLYSNH